MSENARSNPGKHLVFLDSARGIASLMVFGGHFLGWAVPPATANQWQFLFNGNDAVSFFFVLSGFVLSYKYIVLQQPLDFKKFYVARVFRLFPAYFITLVLDMLFRIRQNMSLQTLIDTFVFNKGEFWEEALLIRGHNYTYYPGWTLTFEMVVSFMMPFYITLALKNKKLIGYLFVVLCIINVDLCCTRHFLLGMLAALSYASITSDAFKTTKWYRYRWGILPVAILLFSVRRIDTISPLGPTYKYLAAYIGIDFFLYSALASFVFLVWILQSRSVQQFLSYKVPVFLGKISYSIYLMHPLAGGFILFYVVNGHTPIAPDMIFTIALAYLLLTLILSVLMHYFVELPFIRLGKRITGRMKPSLVIGAGQPDA